MAEWKSWSSEKVGCVKKWAKLKSSVALTWGRTPEAENMGWVKKLAKWKCGPSEIVGRVKKSTEWKNVPSEKVDLNNKNRNTKNEIRQDKKIPMISNWVKMSSSDFRTEDRPMVNQGLSEGPLKA